jgi:hypothetical protein
VKLDKKKIGAALLFAATAAAGYYGGPAGAQFVQDNLPRVFEFLTAPANTGK